MIAPGIPFPAVNAPSIPIVKVAGGALLAVGPLMPICAVFLGGDILVEILTNRIRSVQEDRLLRGSNISGRSVKFFNHYSGLVVTCGRRKSQLGRLVGAKQFQQALESASIQDDVGYPPIGLCCEREAGGDGPGAREAQTRRKGRNVPLLKLGAS